MATSTSSPIWMAVGVVHALEVVDVEEAEGDAPG